MRMLTLKNRHMWYVHIFCLIGVTLVLFCTSLLQDLIIMHNSPGQAENIQICWAGERGHSGQSGGNDII